MYIGPKIFVASIFKATEGVAFRVLVKERIHERVNGIDDAAALSRWIKERADTAESFHAVIREGKREEAAEAWRKAGRVR